MRNSSKFSLMGLMFLCLLSSCTKDNVVENQNEMTPEVQLESRNLTGTEQVIVLAAPSIHNDYYSAIFEDIVDFQVAYANKIEGRDAAIILVDKDTRPYYAGRVPDFVLVDANIEDIWIRDFSPTIADRQVKFDYKPDYLDLPTANFIDNSFERWFRNQGLQYGRKSRLILDGGNVVDNGQGSVIVTDRFLYDNPQLTKAKAKKKLKKLMGAKDVAIIKESPGDVTGHADGMVMWTGDDTILLHEQDPSVHDKIIKELEKSFPGVNIVIVPDYFEYEEWQGFGTACNIFVNALVTNNYIYVPTFNSEHDAEMLDLIQSHSSKVVIEVPAEKVCFMGGSVRCLSWQADGEMAKALLDEDYF